MSSAPGPRTTPSATEKGKDSIVPVGQTVSWWPMRTTSRSPELPAAVLWDMDGTLLDSEPIWDVAMAELAARHGIVMSPELRESTLGNSLPDALAKVHDAAGLSAAERDPEADESGDAQAIDAVRAAKIALDRGVAGPVLPASSYLMKSPPEQREDTEGRAKLEAFIKGTEER